jgi:hypothetical protein
MRIILRKTSFRQASLNFRDALNFYADPKEYEAKKALLFLLARSMNSILIC